MDNRDDHYDPVVEGLSDFAEDAVSYTPKPEPGEPRDAPWLRWVKFASLVIVPTVVLGLGFLFADYVMQFSSETYHQRQLAKGLVEHDSIQSMKWRFAIGSCIGGGLGLVYVVRCIVQKVDP
jgi:hypothetical protein